MIMLFITYGSVSQNTSKRAVGLDFLSGNTNSFIVSTFAGGQGAVLTMCLHDPWPNCIRATVTKAQTIMDSNNNK